jgi:hypothetical protein
MCSQERDVTSTQHHIKFSKFSSTKIFAVCFGRYYRTAWVPPKYLRGALQHNVTFLSGAFGKHERPLVHMFTNALRKNISDKGGVPCTLTT